MSLCKTTDLKRGALKFSSSCLIFAQKTREVVFRLVFIQVLLLVKVHFVLSSTPVYNCFHLVLVLLMNPLVEYFWAPIYKSAILRG